MIIIQLCFVFFVFRPEELQQYLSLKMLHARTEVCLIYMFGDIKTYYLNVLFAQCSSSCAYWNIQPFKNEYIYIFFTPPKLTGPPFPFLSFLNT